MTRNRFTWKIGGASGQGIKITGQMFSRMCIRAGLSLFDYVEYPSLIKGGHNVFTVRVSDRQVHSVHRLVDMLIAFNQETVDKHAGELGSGGMLLYDADDTDITPAQWAQKGVVLLPMPLVHLAKQKGGTAQMRNVVALAATAALTSLPFELVASVLHTAFDRKGDDVVAINVRVAEAAYAYAQEHFFGHAQFQLLPVSGVKRMVMTGNTAIALGAIQAGCGYFAGYPMTPTTSILTFLEKHAEKTGMVVRQPEDEIAVINGAIGASHAGVRSMVATAGGGFSLMVEGVGLSGMTETPVVIVVGQRPGPSTGLPTWTSQGDLQFVLHASQDDFPRIVLTPGDAEECFSHTFLAFNLAERFHLPVFILTDKFLGESHHSVAPFKTSLLSYDRGPVERVPKVDAGGFFARYGFTENGVSARTIPGTPDGMYLANSDEHEEHGFVDETAENRVAMMDKRMRKLDTALDDVPMPTFIGPHAAACTLIGWGSTKGPMLEAMHTLAANGVIVNVLHFSAVFPLAIHRLMDLFRRLETTLVVENNATGQFAQHLQEQAGLLPTSMFLKYDGRPMYPEEIVAKVESLL